MRGHRRGRRRRRHPPRPHRVLSAWRRAGRRQRHADAARRQHDHDRRHAQGEVRRCNARRCRARACEGPGSARRGARHRRARGRGHRLAAPLPAHAAAYGRAPDVRGAAVPGRRLQRDSRLRAARFRDVGRDRPRRRRAPSRGAGPRRACGHHRMDHRRRDGRAARPRAHDEREAADGAGPRAAAAHRRRRSAAVGGTHVRNTSEIGDLRVAKLEKKSARTRRLVLEFA